MQNKDLLFLIHKAVGLGFLQGNTVFVDDKFVSCGRLGKVNSHMVGLWHKDTVFDAIPPAS